MTAPARPAPSGRRARWPIFLGLAVVVVVFDQLTKAWLVSFLAPGERIEVMGEYVRLVHSQNSGALFGLFRDQAIVFALISVGVVGGIIWFHHRSGRNTLLSVALGLLLGGALGNMADRFRIGHVVDFVDLGIGTWRWYTFNVADSAISAAILLLIVSAIVGERMSGERMSGERMSGERMSGERVAPANPSGTMERPDA